MASAGYSIIKRTKGGKELGPYQLRVFVPTSLQPVLGKKEVWRSLKTADRRQAERRAIEEAASIYRDWERLEPAPKGAVNLPSVAVQVGYERMLGRLEEQRRRVPDDDGAYAAHLAQRQADLIKLTRHRQDGLHEHWEGIADRIIAAEGLNLPKGSEAYIGFVHSIADASIDALSVFNRRNAGELDAEPRTPTVRETKAREAAKAKPGETIPELFERWAGEMLDKGEKRLDTVNQDRKVIKQFSAFVGSDRSIESITPIEVAEYRDTMRNLPPKWASNKELRSLDMRAAATKARALSLPKMTFTNVNKHLSTISPLYRWLAAQPAWAGLRNPVDGLFFAKVKGKNPRPPFGTAALNKILGSPLFVGFQGDGSEHVPGNEHADDWRRWLPLACLFTGARIGEIAQLKIGDVRQERGVWFIHIRHEAKAGLTTKSGKSRPAAVHPMLERIGFLAFHQRQFERAGDDYDAPLFPELEPNKRGQISGTPSRWWRAYLEAIGVKVGADGLGAHSFRHTLADRLRGEAELLDDQVEVCLGHNQKTVTSGYGELSQGTVTMFKTWMDAVRFDGVEFAHLIAGKENLKAA